MSIPNSTNEQKVRGCEFDDMPSLPAMLIGIPGTLFVAWLLIWMGAISMEGCSKPYDFPDYSQAQEIHFEQTPNLDAVLEQVIAEGGE